MGCDIHAMVEVRNAGQWKALTDPIFCDWQGKPTADPYHNRNYDLFAMLADVRNGYGFAGVSTGQGFVPIANPRGVPPDASPEYLESVEHYGADGHSHSWHTVGELRAYDWNQTTTKTGVFAEGEWIRSLYEGKRTSWSGGVAGASVEVLSPEEYLAVLGDGMFDKGTRDCSKSYFIRDSWEVAYAERAGTFLTETLPKLETLGAPDDVRLVFYFDN